MMMIVGCLTSICKYFMHIPDVRVKWKQKHILFRREKILNRENMKASVSFHITIVNLKKNHTSDCLDLVQKFPFFLLKLL